jgi:hypothetical protein
MLSLGELPQNVIISCFLSKSRGKEEPSGASSEGREGLSGFCTSPNSQCPSMEGMEFIPLAGNPVSKSRMEAGHSPVTPPGDSPINSIVVYFAASDGQADEAAAGILMAVY